MKSYSILSTFPSISFHGSIRLPACDSEPCLYLAQEAGLEPETGHRCLLQYFAGLQTKLLQLLEAAVGCSSSWKGGRSREGLQPPPLLQPHIATTRPGQGAYLDPGSSLASRFLRQRRQRSEMQGFLADALGVELAATDSERCNRHELCPEAQEEGRRGGHLS